MAPTHTPLVLSGMQPTNTLHLGNYLGALKNWVKLQDQMPCLFCVVDMHAITADAGYGKPDELTRATREVTAAYIAGGIDVARSPIFNQGQVPEHAELAWIFNCVARLGWLDRMTQFKEKSGKHKERASIGLYTYPVLMAADILVYKATHVPVGEDQKQHLELARDIAQKFNNDFGVPDFFPQPEPVITGAATRVMSLRDGTKKMSKSDGLAGRPEAENLLNIYAALADQDRDAVIAQFAGQQFSTFKNALAELTVAKIEPITKEMRRLLADPAEIDRILGAGANKARAIATPIVAEVKKRVGFIA